MKSGEWGGVSYVYSKKIQGQLLVVFGDENYDEGSSR